MNLSRPLKKKGNKQAIPILTQIKNDENFYQKSLYFRSILLDPFQLM
jgi:hypothetical protein